MNQPTRDEFEELKRRVEKVEQEQHQQIQLLRADVQETNILLKRILPDVGTSREKLDTLDRNQQELKQILQQNYNAILEGMVKTVQDETSEIKSALGDIRATQGTHNERFDHLGFTQAEQGKRLDTVDGKLDQILALLQKSGE